MQSYLIELGVLTVVDVFTIVFTFILVQMFVSTNRILKKMNTKPIVIIKTENRFKANKKKPVYIEQVVKKSVWYKFKYTMLGIFGVFLVSFIAYDSVKYWSDFPIYIHHSYESVTGVIDDAIDPTNKTHVAGGYIIEGVYYTDYYSPMFREGDIVTIKYLPHTKMIYTVSK